MWAICKDRKSRRLQRGLVGVRATSRVRQVASKYFKSNDLRAFTATLTEEALWLVPP